MPPLSKSQTVATKFANMDSTSLRNVMLVARGALDPTDHYGTTSQAIRPRAVTTWHAIEIERSHFEHSYDVSHATAHRAVHGEIDSLLQPNSAEQEGDAMVSLYRARKRRLVGGAFLLGLALFLISFFSVTRGLLVPSVFLIAFALLGAGDRGDDHAGGGGAPAVLD